MGISVTRAEHLEFAKRMEEEYTRVIRRIEYLEEQTKQVTDIAISVRELAASVKEMAEEQHVQGAKLEKLEERDGEMWRKVVGYITTAVLGILIGFVFHQMGM